MKYIKECFEAHGSELTKKLKNIGFSNNQIIDFLPEAASKIASASQNKTSADIIINLSLVEPSDLLSTKNISNIIQDKNLSSDQVKSGFKVITPFFLKSFLNYKQ